MEVQNRDQEFLSRKVRLITRLTPHGRFLIRAFGNRQTGEVFTNAALDHLIQSDLMFATDDGEPMAPRAAQAYADDLDPIECKSITDVPLKILMEHVERISTIRPVIEHGDVLGWNRDMIVQRLRWAKDEVRETVKSYLSDISV